MRKLWFDLREAVARAEGTIAGYTAGRSSEAPEPWLVLDITDARLWFTPVNAPRPCSVAVTATHVDGPPPAEPSPLFRQPLTEPDPDGESTLDRLRAAAEQGHRWLVAEAWTPTRLYAAAAYDTDTPPETTVWTPAWLSTGNLGPYPGQTAHGYQHNGSAIARFTRETVQRIAADINARATRTQEEDSDLLVLRYHGNSVEIFVVRPPGTLTDGLAHESSVVGMRQVNTDPDGWYRLIDDRWPWRHATPPPTRSHNEHHGREPELFESHDGPGSRCTVCGATGYDIVYHELPSMAGYGNDLIIWCRICGSSEGFAEEIGWRTCCAIWPPVLDPAQGRQPGTSIDRRDSPNLPKLPPGGRLLPADEAVELLVTGDHPDSSLGSLVVDAALIDAIRDGQIVACLLANGQLAFTRAAQSPATPDAPTPHPGSTTDG